MGGVALKEDAEASGELAYTRQKPVVSGGGVRVFSVLFPVTTWSVLFLGSGYLWGVEDGNKADLELPAKGPFVGVSSGTSR